MRSGTELSQLLRVFLSTLSFEEKVFNKQTITIET